MVAVPASEIFDFGGIGMGSDFGPSWQIGFTCFVGTALEQRNPIQPMRCQPHLNPPKRSAHILLITNPSTEPNLILAAKPEEP